MRLKPVAHHRPVGLLILTEHDGQPIALLRKRPLKDLRLRQVEWPGVCGLTIEGPPSAAPLSTLTQLVVSEFGGMNAVTHWAVKNLPYESFNKGNYVGLDAHEALLFTAYMPPHVASSITLKVNSGEIVPITLKDLDQLVPAINDWRHRPHSQAGVVVFPHLLESIKVAFKTFDADKGRHDRRARTPASS